MIGMEGYDESEEAMIKRQLNFANQIIKDREAEIRSLQSDRTDQEEKISDLKEEIGKLNEHLAKQLFDSIDKYEKLKFERDEYIKYCDEWEEDYLEMKEKANSFEGSFNSATKTIEEQDEKIKAMEAVIYAVGDYASNHKDDRFGSRRRLLESYEKYNVMLKAREAEGV